MKFPLLSACVLPVAILLAPMLAGCGNIEDEREPAQYPQSGVGLNTPEELSSAQQRSASLEAIPPGAAVPQRIEDQAGGEDIAIGVDEENYADTDPSALTDFRSTLDPYGAWQDDPNYGTVWTPSPTVVGQDFSPYVTAGHWTYDTDYVWVSDYEWGWAPFHYGRWVYLDGRGWSWIPGRQYSGAWVSWRTGYDGYGYIGWAPYPPTWYWRGGYAYGLYGVPRAPYVFCETHDLFHAHVGGRIVQGPQVAGIAAGTRPYVPASPSVNAGNAAGGRQLAHPSVTSGPAPGRLGLQAASVPAPPRGQDRGLMRAEQFSRPATAQAAGGRPPMSMNSSRPTRLPSSAPVANGTRSIGSTSQPSSFGATSARAPSYGPSSQGVSPPYARPMPSQSNQRPTQLPSRGYSSYSGSSPSYGSSPTYRSSPSSGSSFGGYHSSSPSYSSPSSSFRSSPSSSPSFHSAPSSPSFHSAPTSHPSYSAPSHGGGGGGRGRR
ncbi:MAG: DUF6600 domain-containing protein [Polyangiaceae bacterium]